MFLISIIYNGKNDIGRIRVQRGWWSLNHSFPGGLLFSFSSISLGVLTLFLSMSSTLAIRVLIAILNTSTRWNRPYWLFSNLSSPCDLRHPCNPEPCGSPRNQLHWIGVVSSVLNLARPYPMALFVGDYQIIPVTAKRRVTMTYDAFRLSTATIIVKHVLTLTFPDFLQSLIYSEAHLELTLRHLLVDPAWVVLILFLALSDVELTVSSIFDLTATSTVAHSKTTTFRKHVISKRLTIRLLGRTADMNGPEANELKKKQIIVERLIVWHPTSLR